MSRLAEYRLFLREFRRTFRTTGAIAPSGTALARALARFVAQPGGLKESVKSGETGDVGDSGDSEGGDSEGGHGRRILEVGPGTGAVTRQIVSAMRPGDRLDLVELNEVFVAQLREALRTDPVLAPSAERIEIHHRPVEELQPAAAYELIISGLPLNNFEVAEVEAVFDVFSGLAAPQSVLSFFEYVAIRRLKAIASPAAQRTRLRGIGDLLRRRLEGREIRRELIWRNAPPAWVHHVRI